MNPNALFWLAVAAVLLLFVFGRLRAAHRRHVSWVRSRLLFAGLLAVGLAYLNTRHGGG